MDFNNIFLSIVLSEKGGISGGAARWGEGGGGQQWPCSLLAILAWVSVPGIYNRGLMFAAWSF